MERDPSPLARDLSSRHADAMRQAVRGLVALIVYEWLGLAFLRRGWINFDLVWVAALAVAGVVLTVSAVV